MPSPLIRTLSLFIILTSSSQFLQGGDNENNSKFQDDWYNDLPWESLGTRDHHFVSATSRPWTPTSTLPTQYLKPRLNDSDPRNYGKPVAISRRSPTHFVVDFQYSDPLWFQFLLENASGVSIQIDIKNVPLEYWRLLKPVYANTESPFAKAQRDLEWQLIREVSYSENTLTLKIGCESDNILVAMYVPFSKRFEEKWISNLKSNPRVKVHEIGVGTYKDTLYAIELNPNVDRNTPCVLAYAADYVEGRSSSWVVVGLVDRLLETSQTEVDANKKQMQMRYLVVPMLNPTANVRNNRMSTFTEDCPSPESLAYIGFFRSWVDAGNRLDIAVHFLSVLSPSKTNVVLTSLGKGDFRHKYTDELHRSISSKVKQMGATVSIEDEDTVSSEWQLLEWISKHMNTISLRYLINTVDEDHVITEISELKEIGGRIADTFSAMAGTELSTDMIQQIDVQRKSLTPERQQKGHLMERLR